MHNVVILDFETDSSNPETCNPTQLSCLVINPRTLTIIPGSEFNSFLRPIDIKEEKYVENHKDTIEFHAKHQHATAEEVVANWRKAPEQKQVWTNFVKYLDRYHTRQSNKSMFTAPLICGYNILGFDYPIIERLSKLYGNVGKDGRSNLFFNRDKIDLMHYAFTWFENLPEPLSYNLDTMRDFLGISKEGSHDAFKDVEDCAEIFIYWQKMIRGVAEKVRFKQAFARKNENE